MLLWNLGDLIMNWDKYECDGQMSIFDLEEPKKKMKILVACEESQRVCIEFRKRGHEAYSCDIEPCSGGHPEWHLQQDVIPLLNQHWDMIIAFPPCTYLTNAGARHLYKGGVLNQERYKKGIEAKQFFMKFYNADCEKISIENPTPSRIFELPEKTQVLQPYQFGHPFTKRTKGIGTIKTDRNCCS